MMPLAKHPALNEITWDSLAEKRVATILERELNVKIIEGATYQRQLIGKYRADFFLPEQGIVLEHHPILLKWYMPQDSLNHWVKLKSRFPGREQAEIEDLFKEIILADYTKRRIRLF